ncbi:putative immunoglobulin-blocking virulence protein [Mycoplasma sp. 1654_15]|uniref:putative immunoglobulin-blocking virulence protein n=1 Tax=Mycoplasma sp. 1654_15 TaxID=2725994 RepID=UPI001449C474|nr:putative immunoglobulin-blocking virulence protein [Mycoplasma sp. 1654_15]QJB71542.1 putative immunoglobulin-blocking virulence protein [Mycoplasma sp. 1654_15]
MKLILKPKNKKIFSSFLVFATASISVGVVSYAVTQGTETGSLFYIYEPTPRPTNNSLTPIKNPNLEDPYQSLEDKNLKEQIQKPVETVVLPKPKPPIVEAQKIEQPKPIDKLPEVIVPKPIDKIVEPEKPIEEQIEAPVIIEQQQPEVKPVPQPEVKPTPPKPFVPQENEAVKQYTWHGIDITALVTKAPVRDYDAYDKENHLANRVPYRSEIIDEIKQIQVTDDIKRKNVENTRTALRNSFQGGAFNIYESDIKQGDVAVAAIVKQNWENYYKNAFFKWRELFDNGDAVVPFLKPEGQNLYPSIKAKYESDLKKAQEELKQAEKISKQLLAQRPKAEGFDARGREVFSDVNKAKLQEWQKLYNAAEDKRIEAKQHIEDAKNVKYAKLIYYIDYSKFSKVDEETQKYLEKGLTIEPDNANIQLRADGTLESHSWSPITNKTTALYTRDNLKKRAFGYNSYYWRPGGDILSGKYPGWTKTDITTQYSQYGASKTNGITVAKLRKDLGNNDETVRNEGIVVTIDMKNNTGYSKTKKFIEDLIRDKKEITSYRFLNMGATDGNQKFKDILLALPNKLPQLELFIEGTNHNTSFLSALEDKEIDELSIYTQGNSLAEDWSINPWALKNVAWYNTNDYNVSSDYAKGAKVATIVSFNSLAFDDSDYKGDGNYKRINDGLRMAYWTRNNEKVFQGHMGPGLNPDTKESENSYPTGLDLTRVTKTKSLRGLIFYDEKKPSNSKPRRLNRIGLYNNSNTFEITAEELNEAHFDVLDTSNPFAQPKPKIFFANDSATRNIKVVANSKVQALNSTGANNLNILLKYAKQKIGDSRLFQPGQKILVNSSDTQLQQSLRNLGFNVQVDTGITYE